jgi:hypothetical protein
LTATGNQQIESDGAESGGLDNKAQTALMAETEKNFEERGTRKNVAPTLFYAFWGLTTKIRDRRAG